MTNKRPMTRRSLLETAVLGTIAGGLAPQMADSVVAATEPGRPVPLKIGIRAASLRMVGDFDVIKTAAGIPGILGVELQTTAGKANLRDWDVVRRYKREADRWAMRIPSLAGVWDANDQGLNRNTVKPLFQGTSRIEVWESWAFDVRTRAIMDFLASFDPAKEHEAIVDALDRGDGKKAGTLLASHAKRSMKYLQKEMAKREKQSRRVVQR